MQLLVMLSTVRQRLTHKLLSTAKVTCGVRNRRALCCCLSCACILFALISSLGQMGLSQEIIRDERITAQFVQQKNLANAHLENGDYAAAEKMYESLQRALPKELLPLQNLVITYLLQLDQQPVGARRGLAGRADEAAMTLLRAAPESPEAHCLAARVLLIQAEQAERMADRQKLVEQAVSLLVRSRELANGDVMVAGTLLDASRLGDSVAVDTAAVQAVQAAFESAPRNLVLARLWLKQQVNAKDENVAETLKLMEDALVVRGLDEGHAGEYLEQALAAVAQGRWPEVWKNTQGLSNSLTGSYDEWHRVFAHPLRFVMHDFESDAVQQAAHDSLAMDSTARLVSMPKERPLSQLKGISDLWIVDLDLDGVLEVVLLRPGWIEVYSKQDESWELLCQRKTPAQFGRVLATDLHPPPFVLTPIASTKSSRTSGYLSADVDARAAVGLPIEATEFVPFHRVYPSLVLYGRGGLMVLKPSLSVVGGRTRIELIEERAAFPLIGDIEALSTADLDNDGDLDLIASVGKGVRVLINNSDDELAFADMTHRLNLPGGTIADFTVLACSDFDRNGDIDLVGIARDSGSIVWLQNHGSLYFSFVTLDVPRSVTESCTGLAVFEADGNYSWDLAVAGQAGVYVIQTRTDTGHVSVLRTTKVADNADGVLTLDVDNDSHIDLLTWGSRGLELFRGGADGTFSRATGVVTDMVRDVQLCRTEDLDGDGDMDVAGLAAGKPVLLDNRGGNQRGWIRILTRGDRGEARGIANHYGIGAVVEVKTGTSYQAQIVSGTTPLHFGLGEGKSPNVVRIVFPGCSPQVAIKPKANVTLLIGKRIRGPVR